MAVGKGSIRRLGAAAKTELEKQSSFIQDISYHALESEESKKDKKMDDENAEKNDDRGCISKIVCELPYYLL